MSAGGWEEPSWEPSPGLEKSTPSCWDAAQGRVGIPSPGSCQSWPLDSRKKKKREANFCASVAVKVSFLPSFLFFLGMLYLHFSSLFLSLGQNLPRRAGGVLLGMLNQEQPVPYQFSVSRGGRKGREEGGGSLAKPFATASAEPGGNSGLSSACSAFSSRLCLGNFGVKSRFLNSPAPPRADF